jgi:hypothetical protein
MMEFSDQDLRLVLNRAFRSVAIAIAVGIPVIWIAWGWRSMLMFLVGGAIAATGILEWRQLMTAVLERLDLAGGASQGQPRGKPRPLGSVLFWFFIRIVAAAAVLYVSLRSFGR